MVALLQSLSLLIAPAGEGGGVWHRPPIHLKAALGQIDGSPHLPTSVLQSLVAVVSMIKRQKTSRVLSSRQDDLATNEQGWGLDGSGTGFGGDIR
jgi:hypothetical protein